MLCCTQMKQKNWSAKDILESAYYVVLLYKMKKKKHCGHQYIKVIRKVIIYLGPNLILQIPVPSPIWVWLESESNWVSVHKHLHHLSWWQDLISNEEYRQQSNEDIVMEHCLHKILCIPSNMLRKIWENVMYWYWPLSFTKLDVAASLAKKKRLEVVIDNWVR